MSFITSESVHLQLEQINLRNVSVMLRRISAIVTCLPLPFISYTLDEIFVEIANIQMPYALVDVQLEFLLRDALLDSLAEGGVARGPDAALAVLDEAAALAVARGGGGGGGGPFAAVLLGAKAVHLLAQGRPLWGKVPRRPLRSRAPRGAGRRGPRTRGSQSPSSAEALPGPAPGRPGSAALRLLRFPARVSTKPLPPCSRPRGRLPRLAGPRRESP